VVPDLTKPAAQKNCAPKRAVLDRSGAGAPP
jgi:hypothetical protein